MSTRSTKVLAATVAALTLLGTLAVSTKEAEARRWHRGYGYGLGAAAAIIGTAAIIAATRPAPVCESVPVYNRRGVLIGYREVC